MLVCFGVVLCRLGVIVVGRITFEANQLRKLSGVLYEPKAIFIRVYP